MCADELEQPRMDGRPDASALGSGRSRSGRKLLELPQPGEIVDRHLDADLELLSRSRVHDGDRPRPPLLAAGLASPEQARHLVERTLGRREPDPLELAPRLQLQPLQREEEVRAALGCDERVDLVDDDGRSEEHTSELQSRSDLVCRLLLEKKKKNTTSPHRTEKKINEFRSRSEYVRGIMLRKKDGDALQ